MTTLAPSAAGTRGLSGPLAWLSQVVAWLDARGKGAWIAAMVLAFVFVWPLGLAILGYMIFRSRPTGTAQRCGARMNVTRSSGNAAFDAYRDETLRRLQDEQRDFESFLDRLRQAKDKSEFDQFMKDRARGEDRADADDDAPQTRET